MELLCLVPCLCCLSLLGCLARTLRLPHCTFQIAIFSPFVGVQGEHRLATEIALGHWHGGEEEEGWTGPVIGGMASDCIVPHT